MKAFLTKIKAARAYRDLVPLDTTLSLPAIDFRPGGPVVQWFGFRSEPRPDRKGVILHRPFLFLEYEWPSGRLCRYERLQHSRLPEEIEHAHDGVLGEFPHDELSGWTLAQYRSARTDLDRACEESLDAGKPSATYIELFERLAPPRMIPYFKHFNPTLPGSLP